MSRGLRVGLFLILMVASSAITAGAVDGDSNLLHWPESVVFDAPRDRYIVSNWGDGDLVAMTDMDNQWNFNTDLEQAAGLCIQGGVIYTAASEGAITGVVGFDLESGEMVAHIRIPELELLNDITGDNAGHLFVTDCDGDKIYKITLSSMTYTRFVDDGLGYPNGLLFDELNNRLLVINALLPNGPILAVDLADSSTSHVAYTWQTGLDGLTVDNDGYIYFSSWTADCVFRLNPDFSGYPEAVSCDFQDPADIGFNLQDQILAVPNFYQNRVDFLPLAQQSVDERIPPQEQGHLQCAPNPFTGSTTFRLDAVGPRQDFTVSIHDHLGRCIRTLANPGLQAEQALVWDGLDARGQGVASGTYFVRMQSVHSQISRRIIRID